MRTTLSMNCRFAAALLIASACASSHSAPGDNGAPAGEGGGAQLPEAQPSPFMTESAIRTIARSCEAGSSRDIGFTDDIESGFSAEDVLRRIEGKHVTVIRWLQPDSTTIEPEIGEHALFVGVERASERARVFTPEREEIGHGTRCEDWIEVDVRLTFQTDGGAFNEAIDGTLYTSDPRVAYFRASASDDAFGGDLEVRSSLPGALSRFDLDLALSSSGVSGALSGIWLVPDQEGFEQPQQLASIGAVSCSTAELALGPDAALPLSIDGSGPTSSDLLEKLELLPPLALTWLDGARTTVTLRFEADEEGACVAISATAPEDFASAAIHGQVTMESADGRVSGSWPAVLKQTGAGGELAGTLYSTPMSEGATATPAELGFPGLDRGQLTSISVNLYLTLEGANATGQLRLEGRQCNSGSLDAFCEPVELESASIAP